MSNGWAQLKQYLSRPHYWEDRPWAIFRQALGFGAITFAVLWFFEPFGFYQLSSAALLMVSLEISAAVIFFICLNWWLLYRLFPNFEPADQWMVKHELILTLFTTLLIAVAVGGILHAHDIIVLLNLRQAFKVLLNTALIALVPILIFVARDQNRLLKRHLNQAEQYTRQLDQPEAAPIEHLVSLTDENGKPVLQLPAERILFLQAAGNYAEVHFIDETRQPRRELLRNRLKVLSEVLPEDQFIQCHRSYLANRQLIRQVKGNARNYELVLEGTEQTVPVARSKAAPVMAIIGKT